MVERLSQGVVMIRLVLGLAGERDSERDATGVERAIAEFRSARPVVVEGPTGKALVVGVEDLDAARPRASRRSPAARRTSCCRRRACAASASTGSRPAPSRCPSIDLVRIETLALKIEAAIDAPVGPASALDEEALELARLSLVLPAVIVVPLARASRSIPRSCACRARRSGATARRKVRDLQIVSRAPVPLEGAPETRVRRLPRRRGPARPGRDHRRQARSRRSRSPVRLHSACLTGDLFGRLKCDCGDQLRDTVQWMARERRRHPALSRPGRPRQRHRQQDARLQAAERRATTPTTPTRCWASTSTSAASISPPRC